MTFGGLRLLDSSFCPSAAAMSSFLLQTGVTCMPCGYWKRWYFQWQVKTINAAGVGTLGNWRARNSNYNGPSYNNINKCHHPEIVIFPWTSEFQILMTTVNDITLQMRFANRHNWLRLIQCTLDWWVHWYPKWKIRIIIFCESKSHLITIGGMSVMPLTWSNLSYFYRLNRYF